MSVSFRGSPIPFAWPKEAEPKRAAVLNTEKPKSDGGAVKAQLPLGAVKAYSPLLFAAKPLVPVRFGAAGPGGDFGTTLRQFTEGSLERLWSTAVKNAPSDQVTPEDLTLAILKDFKADLAEYRSLPTADKADYFAQSYLGKLLGLDRNPRFLQEPMADVRERNEKAVKTIDKAIERLEAHTQKNALPAATPNKSPDPNVVQCFEVARKLWKNASESYTPGAPVLINEDILLQVMMRHSALAAKVIWGLFKDLDLKPWLNIAEVGGEELSKVAETSQEQQAPQLPAALKHYDSRALQEYGLQHPGIVGQEPVKKLLTEVFLGKNKAAQLDRLGLKPSASVLLYGAEGTGKTDLVLETASRQQVADVFYLPGKKLAATQEPEALRQAVQQTLHAAEELSRQRQAEGKPSQVLVFMDNLESGGAPAGEQGAKSLNPLTQGFLEAAAQLKKNALSANVVLVGSTTDEAVTRGLVHASAKTPMVDKLFQLNPPSAFSMQVQVVRQQAERINQKAGANVFPDDLDYGAVASRLVGVSGKGIFDVLNNALERAVLSSGAESPVRVTNQHLDEALNLVTLGPEDREVFDRLPAARKRVVAYHETGHALTSLLMQRLFGGDKIQVAKLSIIPRNQTLGHTLFENRVDRREAGKSRLFSEMVKALGSLPAERLVAQESHDSVSHDLQRANALARKMIAEYGMGRNPVVYKEDQPLPKEVQHEIRYHLRAAEEVARLLLNEYEPLVREVAEALTGEAPGSDTMSGAELERRLDRFLAENPKQFAKTQQKVYRLLDRRGIFPGKFEKVGLRRRSRPVQSGQ